MKTMMMTMAETRLTPPVHTPTALLLIVHMGRRKYHMHGKQHGRNMLICEYIWIAWKQQTLPPGAPAPPQYTMQEVKPCQCKPPKKPHRDDEQCWVKVKHDWYRERKQVSSHIQVIKNFFRFHPACELSPPVFIILLSSDMSLCFLFPLWGPM